MNQLSVLQNFKSENLKLYPFPYIHIENALPQNIYDQLANEYPESVLGGITSNFKDHRYYQHEFTDQYITPLWKQFVDFHSSKEYKDQVIMALEPGMRKYYPEITDKYLKSDVVPRRSTKDPSVVQMEVQFVMNSADTIKIRTPHLDEGRELFACLFYMKRPDDNSKSGDLVVFKKKENFKFNPGRTAPEDQIEEASRIPYKANSLVIFLNTIDSIHGVDPRKNASVLRRYVNIDAHIREKLFVID
jgi:hypothetical protein